ncbi:MAG: hypothetical protein A2654_01835 [Candidatus Nealsonbacteria bacterium RIFCSPHIGHO2_01_FULL_43_31]|uniref:CARDB domain-containing protein n=2 Tax=Candidatus Nealsoniibacteriota TaxID=1817911 RepID=A0A1G2EAQ5_9BACT|nr:MAG: hypothetical protein A2654_01835 [Candidatus Nealsonbacteria bacterium RIFCSPHIGHO2_01_FULL_43_31]OGZ22360.1 MAG: hypothetical protein A3D46_00630 [Candidatus Nealsonbacteria bacterium RIFCSPHIGHO2_02_FULL_43_13]OGZ25273.1 MAG: hypothetical protein A2922_01190 [Candidatus Nealsonbacteria bacterium RIFCSPLOWO2_01_FULL_43_36]
MNRSVLFFAMLVLMFFVLSGDVRAKADLSLTASDITFSKETALAGEKIRIFGRVFNVGDEDVSGFVVFAVGGKAIGEPQPISVKVGTYDDVFIDWVFEKGSFAVGAEIIGTRPLDEDSSNNEVLRENYFVDADSDNDGVTDKEEIILGTDSLNSDTDNDGVTDKKEIALGTNPLSPDTDNDGVTDKEEIALGINPLSPDTDNDGLADKEEIALGTNSLKIDTDGDLIPDKTEVKIVFLNPNRNEWKPVGSHLASVVGAVKMAVEEGNMAVAYLFAALGFLSIIFLISRFLHKN